MLTQTIARPHEPSATAAPSKEPAAMSTNCYTLNGSGLREKFEVTLEHPRNGLGPALSLDQSFVKVDSRHPCPIDENGSVTHANIKWVEVPNRRPMPLLVQPETTGPQPLLYVSTRMELPRGATFREYFHVGIETAGEIVGWSSDHQEMLVRLRKGHDLLAYFPDGSVRQVMWEGGPDIAPALHELKLSINEQAGFRVRRIDRMLEENKRFSGDERIRKEDGLYHELVAILNVGGTRLSTAFDTIYDRLEGLKKKGELRPSVERHTVETLQRHWPQQALYFRDAVMSSALGRNSAPGARKGPPAHAVKKRAERSARDRARSDATKGTTGGGPKKK